MKLRYLEEGEEIPSLEEDIDFDPKAGLPEVKWHSWVDEIKVQLDDGAIMPQRAFDSDAGFDLYAPKDMPVKYLWKNDSIVIDTKVHMLLPSGTAGIVISKSGLNIKHSITSTGLVDAHYTGSIRVKLYNHGDERLKIEPGDKISQIVIVPIYTPKLILAKELPKTERGNGSLGSTGRK